MRLQILGLQILGLRISRLQIARLIVAACSVFCITAVYAAQARPATSAKPAAAAAKASPESIAQEVRDQLLALAAPIENTKDKGLKNGKSQARILQDVKPLTIKTEDTPRVLRHDSPFVR